MIVERVRVPMLDGIGLVADLYRPRSGVALPTLLMRTPYDRRKAETMLFAHPGWYARQGYAVMVQDVRGRFDSEGSFDPWVEEAADGTATLEWIAAQPWCDGRVGMYGFSYPGSLQLLAAASRHPALRAIVPVAAPLGMGEGLIYSGGAFALGFALGWALDLALDPVRRLAPDREPWLRHANDNRAANYLLRPLLDHPVATDPVLAPYYAEWIRRAGDDPYWGVRRVPPAATREVAALFIGGWHDPFVAGTLQGFADAHPDRGALVVGPWLHYPNLTPQGPPGPDAHRSDSPRFIEDLQLAWFDRWLRDAGGGRGPRVQVRWTGGGWETASDWPPPTVTRRLHLRSGGRANSRFGDGRLSLDSAGAGEPPDTYVHDPAVPVTVPDASGAGYPILTPAGPADQAAVEASNSVLVFTSDALERPVDVVGSASVELSVETTAASADWVTTLCDVSPDGVSREVARGVLRTTSQGRVRVAMRPVAHRFRAGHRVRLQVAGAAFPVWEPNPGTARPLGVDRLRDLVVAMSTIHHEQAAPSWLDLPCRT